MRRVAVTGLGVVSALGPDLASFREGLFQGRSGIRRLDSFPPGLLRFPNGAEVSGYSSAQHFDAKQAAMLDLFTQYGLVAAREAVRQSGINFVPQRTAVIAGSGGGGQLSTDEAFVDLYQRGQQRVNPFSIPKVMTNAAVSAITMEFGITGPSYTVSTACSSANHAIGQAFWMVRSGQCDAAITGGSEAVFGYGFMKGWEAMRVVSPDTCRPFSIDRQGMILGEGAGMLVLEPLEAAVARGVEVMAEIVGFGMSADAHHITQPSPDGAALAMRSALEDAACDAGRVRYINAHGTGTIANDPAETLAIRKAFGQNADRLCVSSTKSMHGHALGAAGALEATATVLALRHGCVPPTANFTQPDPSCNIDVVANTARLVDIEYGMSNSFAFGGLNAVLLFRRAD